MAQIMVSEKCIMCSKVVEHGDMGYLIARAKFTKDPKYQPYGDREVPGGKLRALLVHSHSNGLVCNQYGISPRGLGTVEDMSNGKVSGEAS